ncbi:hypothetical protein M2272_005629 [Mycobacterium frederiksbergense]|uniref:Resolvase/invertase-type recombinase catalytic domain-containing protein n=1 Tax=Mycolicibacterium frederiksbergense TaxID=117567 RepID=A0ABT6LAF9_9MYCO|nr:recombinase family protein [Mycolicibacterium frederiksbergense]MDH6198965.1 hypothetical protein [Mycolicibacterium frederiksbergense]
MRGKSIGPKLQEVLQLLAAGQSDDLVVLELDHLSRSIVNASNIIEAAQQQRWSLAILDLTTAAGRSQAMMLISFAQNERELISERTKSTLAAKKRRCEPAKGLDDSPAADELSRLVVRSVFDLKRSLSQLKDRTDCLVVHNVADLLWCQDRVTILHAAKQHAGDLGLTLCLSSDLEGTGSSLFSFSIKLSGFCLSLCGLCSCLRGLCLQLVSFGSYVPNEIEQREQ